MKLLCKKCKYRQNYKCLKGVKFDWMMRRYIEMYSMCDLFPHINCQVVLGYLIAKRLSRKYREDMIESIYYN